MANKEELKKKLDEVRAKIKSNSKDAHFAEVLCDELVSLKGQLSIEPTALHIPLSDIVDSIDGETFTLAKTKQGLLYHQKNGFDLFIPVNGMTNGLCEQALWLIEMKDKIEEESDGLKDYYEATMLEIAYTFQMIFGMWMADKDFIEFRMKSISEYIDLITAKIKEAENAPLQEETHEENAEFEKTVQAIETLKEEVKREEAELKS